MENIKEDLNKKLGKFVSLTVEENVCGETYKVNYEGVILPKFCIDSDSFVSKNEYIIYNLISDKKTIFRADNIIDIKTKRCSAEIKSIISDIYKLSKEKIKIESNKYLIEQKERENKEKLLESINKIKEIEGAMTFWEFRDKIEEYLLKEIKGCKMVKSDYGNYSLLTIDNYTVSMFGGEDDDYDGLYLIKFEKEIDIDKYAHTSGYSFIHGESNDYYDTKNLWIDTDDKGYNNLLKKYENANKKIINNSLDANIKEKSYFSLGDKGWLSYTHTIDIVFRKSLLPREKNISNVVDFFKNN